MDLVQEESATGRAALFDAIIRTVGEFMAGPANDLGMAGGPEPAFDPPIFGVASGADPIWETYKIHVAADHWTPAEAFARAFPGECCVPTDLSVFSWVLPQTRRTRRDHSRAALLPTEQRLPSERWARNRMECEVRVNEGLKRHLAAYLRTRGIAAVAPTLVSDWAQLDSEKFTFTSTWSERHAAHAAGLGTFGLCDGLITPRGKAMRTGSMVVRAYLPATPRPYSGHRDYCLFFNEGTCGVCIDRCPAKALSPQGHDKRRCKAFLHSREVVDLLKNAYGIDGYACGLCQVAVPCEARIPPQARRTLR